MPIQTDTLDIPIKTETPIFFRNYTDENSLSNVLSDLGYPTPDEKYITKRNMYDDKLQDSSFLGYPTPEEKYITKRNMYDDKLEDSSFLGYPTPEEKYITKRNVNADKLENSPILEYPTQDEENILIRQNDKDIIFPISEETKLDDVLKKPDNSQVQPSDETKSEEIKSVEIKSDDTIDETIRRDEHIFNSYKTLKKLREALLRFYPDIPNSSIKKINKKNRIEMVRKILIELKTKAMYITENDEPELMVISNTPFKPTPLKEQQTETMVISDTPYNATKEELNKGNQFPLKPSIKREVHKKPSVSYFKTPDEKHITFRKKK
jgi:hypothetical protein